MPVKLVLNFATIIKWVLYLDIRAANWRGYPEDLQTTEWNASETGGKARPSKQNILREQQTTIRIVQHTNR